MKPLINSFTRIGSGNIWSHHWWIRATCRQEALDFVNEHLALGDDHGMKHWEPFVRRWRDKAYEVVQGGWLG